MNWRIICRVSQFLEILFIHTRLVPKFPSNCSFVRTMIVSTIATGVSRLLDIVLSAYIYNDEYRYPFFIAFTQFTLLSLFTKVYTSIRTSKCIAGTIKDDDILSPTTQSVRSPKITRRMTLLIATSWFITRVFSNLNNVEVRVARASEVSSLSGYIRL